jgi:chitodextrinase
VSVAAAKRTVLVAASIAAAVALAAVMPAAGAPDPDREAPSTPANMHVTSATQSLVTVAWDPSTDNVGVVGYYVWGDKGKVGLGERAKITVDGPQFTVSGLGCGRSAVITVAAFDAAGNRSARASSTVATSACLDTQAPTAPTGFSQVATTQGSVILSWTPAFDNTGVVGYDVFRDLLLAATPSDPSATLSNLSCGTTYPYSVDAVDAAGNHSARASVYVRTAACSSSGDTTSPSTPTGLSASNVTSSGLTLSWSASSDNVAVTGYDLYRNGSKVATVNSTSATHSRLACGTTYAFGVVARDAAGNASGQAQLSTATTACAQQPPTGDTTPPSTPTGLSASNVTSSGLSLSWSASSDNVAVTGYDLYRNGSKVATVNSTSATQSGLACGTTYAFGVVARDAAGNASGQAQLSTATTACSQPPTTDTTPPSTPSALAVAGATPTTVGLTWAASSDNVGVAGYRVYVDGAYSSTTAQTGTSVSGLACGTAYTFAIEAFDAAGNTSSRASVTVSTSPCADTQAPTVPSSVTALSRTTTSIALSWSASTDNVSVAGYGLYQGGVQQGTTTTTTAIFSGLTCNTNYTLAVDAYDAAGNRSTKGTVMVATTGCPDTTPPSAPTNLTVSNVTQSGATLGWNASTDNVGVTGYDVYRNGAKVSSVTTPTSDEIGLVCGTSYTYGVVARDAAGNSSPTTQVAVTTAACATPSPGWTYCAQENKDCVFSGTKEVEYGANGTFTSPRTFTSGVACTNTVFGDPAPNVAKFCQYRDVTSVPPTGSSTGTGTALSSFSSFKNNAFGEAPNGHIFEHRWYSSDSGGTCSVWTGLSSTCTAAWPDGSGVSEVSTPYGPGFNMRAYSGFKRASGALMGLADINHLVPTSGYLGTTTEISGNIMFPSAGNPKTSTQPTGFPAYGDWNVLWEFTQSSLVGNRIGIDATTAGGPKLYVMTSDPSNPNAPNGRKAWSPTIQFDRWYTFRWQIHWSNNSDGWVNFWWDGQQIASWTGRSINTSAGNPYVEMGWYGGDAQARNEVVWAGLQSG